MPAPTPQAEDKQVELLTLLAEAAQAQGYSLDDLERLLGVPSSNGNGVAKKLSEPHERGGAFMRVLRHYGKV